MKRFQNCFLKFHSNNMKRNTKITIGNWGPRQVNFYEGIGMIFLGLFIDPINVILICIDLWRF